MSKGFSHILHNRLRQLPEYQPDTRLWNRIEESLNLDAEIDKKLEHLPLHQPAKATWDAIEARMHDRNDQAVSQKRTIRLSPFLYRAIYPSTTHGYYINPAYSGLIPDFRHIVYSRVEYTEAYRLSYYWTGDEAGETIAWAIRISKEMDDAGIVELDKNSQVSVRLMFEHLQYYN